MHTGANASYPRRRFFIFRSRGEAFTLVELLVVVGTIAILAGLLLPSFVGAKEKGRRTACKGQLQQFLLGVHMYANDNVARLPSGLSENSDATDEHLPVVSKATRDSLIQYSGSRRVLKCPSLMKPFNTESGWHYQNYGFVLGYNYLGGHGDTPWPVSGTCSNWVSPQTANDDSSLVLVTDMNDWSPGFRKAFAPHANHGPVIKDNDFGRNPQGASSRDIGAAGGNLALLDGSVNWKKIRQMNTHQGSRRWEDDGCFAAW